MRTTLTSAIPILRVEILETSLDYYVRVLGFTIDWQSPGVIASVSRDRCCLFLCEGDQGHAGSWVWIDADDIETLCKEFRDKGAMIRHPPTNYMWAYEMQVEDPDGHVLRFGSDPKSDQPYGEWLDMNGGRWIESPEGWARVGYPRPL